MGADLRTFLDHGDHQVWFELFQSNGAGQSGGSGPHDDDVIFHDFAFCHRLFFLVFTKGSRVHYIEYTSHNDIC